MRTTGLAASGAVMILSALLGAGCVTPGDTISGPVASASNWVQSTTSGGATSGQDEPQDPNLTPAEQRMRQQSRAFQKTVWEGALLGASAGAAWGVIRGDDTKDILKKALMGGAAGGLAGTYVAHKQSQYASKEDQLDSMIADVRESNKQTEELIASVREVIAEDERRLASAQKRFRAGQINEAELTSTRQRVTANKAVVAQAAKGAREKHTMFDGAQREYRERNPGTDTARLQGELDAYNQQIQTLDGLANTISAA